MSSITVVCPRAIDAIDPGFLPTKTTRHATLDASAAPAASFLSTCTWGSICLSADTKPLRVDACTTETERWGDAHSSAWLSTVSTTCTSNLVASSSRENVSSPKHEVLIVNLCLVLDGATAGPPLTLGRAPPASGDGRKKMNRRRDTINSHASIAPFSSNVLTRRRP